MGFLFTPGRNEGPEMPADLLEGRSLGHGALAVWIEDGVTFRNS